MPEYKTFYDRIQACLSEKGWTVQELGKKSGISPDTLYQYKRGSHSPKKSRVRRLAEILEVNPDWLETGSGRAGVLIRPGGSGISIPIFDVSAGWKTIYDDGGHDVGGASEFTEVVQSKDPEAFMCTINGDSMEPLFPNGYYILIEPSRVVRNRDYVVFFAQDDDGDFEGGFKQVLFEGPDFVFHPLNDEYEDLRYRRDQVKMMRKVVNCFMNV